MIRYFLLLNLATALYLLVYAVLLRNTTQFRWNRIYLLSAAILPALLLQLHIPTPSATNRLATFFSATLPQIDVHSTTTSTGWASVLTVANIYWLGIAVTLSLFTYRILSIRLFLHRHRHTAQHTGSYTLLTNTGFGPGSFGSYIFMPATQVDPAILAHEAAHVRYRHTLDIIILSIAQIILWPNLVLHLIRRELQQQHEFEADAIAASAHTGYGHLLLNSVFSTTAFSMSQTFFQKPIKRRIMMLHKKAQTSSANARRILGSLIAASAVVLSTCYLQACTHTTYHPDSTTATAEKVVEHPDVMAAPNFDLPSYLSSQMHYPEQAKRNKIEGRVVVSFIVDKYGKIKSPQIKRSPDQALSDEALRVISAMPDWKPGTVGDKPVAVQYYLPVSFKL